VAATLRTIPGLDVEVSSGARGEFSVAVDGHKVIDKDPDLPSVEDVVKAVQDATSVKPGV
jgi:hypothetical protein